MRIPEEIISERNYEGTRLVEVTDPKVAEMKEILKKMQVEEVNPILDEALPYQEKLDPYYAKVAEHKKTIASILERARPLQEEYARIMEGMDPKSEEASPEVEGLADKMKTEIAKVQEEEAKISSLRESMKDTIQKHEELMRKVETVDKRAQLVKDKLVRLVNRFIEKDLREFDRAIQLIEKDGKVFAEVVDQVEEKIKQIRAERLKAKA